MADVLHKDCTTSLLMAVVPYAGRSGPVLLRSPLTPGLPSDSPVHPSSSFPVLAIVGKNQQFIADQLLGNRALCPKCAASKLFYKVPSQTQK